MSPDQPHRHRAALDHVLTVIAESSWAERLVLRGSMTMPAWIGDAARTPGDLDWMVPQPLVTTPDRQSPDPYHDTLKPVQEWPEAVHGAIRNEMWEFEEFDTRGRRCRLPPDGLTWVSDLEQPDSQLDFEEVVGALLTERPWSPEGIVFAPGEISSTSDWEYQDYDDSEPDTGRVRITIPWHAPDFEIGSVQIDLSFGEHLPEPPVCTAIPRAGGQSPLGLWTPSRELSLAWKLHWLAADQDAYQRSAMKDVYDAVLLAESPGIRLRPYLRRVALGATPRGSLATASAPHGSLDAAHHGSLTAAPVALPYASLLSPSAVLSWTIEGPLPDGDSPAAWLSRLAAVTDRLLHPLP
ncbi:nucleotidyl transferase AbiEii/AbiGii toxin family protein [Actinoplanes sp. G11-F43]|uniref:nucleotidyl transferase AbiEii/AbiGii toxin family protein n=1 Tax=Actinoplanes sp. G11-F43 TaxID=3424130 RepID=UPI003D356B72